MPEYPYPVLWKHHPNLLYLSIRRSCGAINHSRSLSLEQEFYLSHWTQQSAAVAHINILVAPVEELRANCPFWCIEHLLTHPLSLLFSHYCSFSIFHLCPLYHTGPFFYWSHTLLPLSFFLILSLIALSPKDFKTKHLFGLFVSRND